MDESLTDFFAWLLTALISIGAVFFFGCPVFLALFIGIFFGGIAGSIIGEICGALLDMADFIMKGKEQ